MVPKPNFADEESLIKLKKQLLNDMEIKGRCIEVDLIRDRFHFFCEADTVLQSRPGSQHFGSGI